MPRGKKRIAMKTCFVYVTDSRGFDLATLSALSLGLSQPRPCHIRIFCYQFTPVVSDVLSAAIARLGIELGFSDIEDAAAEQHQTHGHVTTPTLLKLRAVEHLIADYDRVIFLDNDILVFEDLKIESLAFGTMPIAAVADMDLSDSGALRGFDWSSAPSRIAGIASYFNAGFMVFESNNWRQDFLGAYERELDQHDIGCSYKVNCTSIDQCALNTVFSGNWLNLPASYNMQASAKFTRSWQTAAARHYCGPRKYVPLSLLRSDRRDVRYLNTINGLLGRPRSRLALVYEAFFRLNAMRNARNARPMRRFLRALQQDGSVAGRAPAHRLDNDNFPQPQSAMPSPVRAAGSGNFSPSRP
jgi:lipopolysaccharide biosynthesis glycosyltransferase